MKHHSRRGLRAVAAVAVASLATIGVVATAPARSSSKVHAASPTRAVKFGYIFSKTGVASSTFQNADKGCQARVDRQNAAGGVNGRKIEVEWSTTSRAAANMTAAKDLVQNSDVFMVVINNSSFAFLDATTTCKEQGVPHGQRRLRRHVLRREGQRGHHLRPRQLGAVHRRRLRQPHQAHEAGGRDEGRGAWRTARRRRRPRRRRPSRSIAVPAQGLDPVYTNTTVDFGTTDVGPLVLGIKNSGADAVYLPLVASRTSRWCRASRRTA